MTALRAWLSRHRALAAWLVAAALLVRIAIPAGFMPTLSGGTMTLTLCSGHGAVTAAMPGMPRGHHMPAGHDGKMDPPCAFSGLTLAATGGADPILLTAAILFIFVTLFRIETAAPARAARFLRPPLRGPPLPA